MDAWNGHRRWTDAGTTGWPCRSSGDELRALLKHDDSVQMLVWNRVDVDIELPSPPALRQVSIASRWEGSGR